MSTNWEKDLERLLRMRPAPLPPAHIAAAIKAEIPAHISVGAFEHEAAPNGAATEQGGFHVPFRLLGLAASVVFAVGVTMSLVWLVPGAGADAEGRGLGTGAEDRAAIKVTTEADPTLDQQQAQRMVAIEVRVLGPDQSPRAGAVVAVEQVDHETIPLVLRTDQDGWAQAAGLAPGTYRLRCNPYTGQGPSDVVTLQAGQGAALLLQIGQSFRFPLG